MHPRAVTLPFALRRRRVPPGDAHLHTRRLRFTREGRYFVGLTLGVGFAAINTGNNLLYLVLGMMLSLIVVSGILSELALEGLSVERSLPREVHVRSPYLTSISVTNQKRRLSSFSVQVEDLIEGHPLAKKCYFLKLPPGARQNTSYRSEFTHRGLYRYRGFHVATRFPFAFFVKTYAFPAPDELIVLPAIHPVEVTEDAPVPRAGPRDRPRRGHGRDFHGLRPHREGDDARDIHWKRTAREGRLVTREYETEAARRVGVRLETRLEAPPTPAVAEALERAVDLAASLVVHHHRRGYDVVLELGGRRYPVGADAHGLLAALRALALVEFDVAPADVPGTSSGPAARGDLRWWLVRAERGQPRVEAPAGARVMTTPVREAA